MPKICYNKRIRFGPETGALLVKVGDIIEDYEARGYKMTLRQLYYQLVASGEISNNIQEYNKLKDIVKRGRLGGYIDWESIEDRTRNLEEVQTWDTPEQLVRACRKSFRLDVWAKQDKALEVWIEKDALVGNIEDTCDELRIPYLSCRGYTSISEMWVGARRITQRILDRKQTTLILHFGDHDPSGIDMTRDIRERLSMFINGNINFSHSTDFVQPVLRVALNMDQIEEFGPPPNPAKLTDSRAADYVETFGPDSWELDALDPDTLNALIRENWEEFVDHDVWNASLAEEETERETLQYVEDNFERIREGLAASKKKVKKKKAKKKKS